MELPLNNGDGHEENEQERVRATDSLMGSIIRSFGQPKEESVQPRGGTNAPAQP